MHELPITSQASGIHLRVVAARECSRDRRLRTGLGEAGCKATTRRCPQAGALAAFCLAAGLRLATAAEIAPIVLDPFNGSAAAGAPIAGSSWAGQVTRNATSITIGGTAQDDNGWEAQNLNLNASGMTAIAITAQREAGHAATNVTIEFQDRNLNTAVFSVRASAFPLGTPATVTIPIGSWGVAFDATHVSGWSIGGGAPPPGSAAFRMTLEHLELTAGGGPPIATLPEITTQPASQTVLAGSGAIFSVVATGLPTPTYQWRRDGVNLAGATNPPWRSPTRRRQAPEFTPSR